jgi:hypothetical protein
VSSNPTAPTMRIKDLRFFVTATMKFSASTVPQKLMAAIENRSVANSIPATGTNLFKGLSAFR